MGNLKYATDEMNDHTAKAVGKDLPISTKHSVNICNAIRGKRTERAKRILEDVIGMRKAIPYRRYNKDLAHKTRIGPGRFPIKASAEVLKLIKSVEANAQSKGLNTTNLVIRHISSHLASRPWHFGRHRGRKAKRSHVQIVVEEVKAKEPKKDKKGMKQDVEKKEHPRAEVKAKGKREVKPTNNKPDNIQKAKAEEKPEKKEAKKQEKPGTKK